MYNLDDGKFSSNSTIKKNFLTVPSLSEAPTFSPVWFQQTWKIPPGLPKDLDETKKKERGLFFQFSFAVDLSLKIPFVERSRRDEQKRTWTFFPISTCRRLIEHWRDQSEFCAQNKT
uniref:Uncharacterized protein n=1 Tax=Romanomermis culicivorax TaxID=13658 RepID=A0A915IQZ7_ROMCU